MHHFVGRCQLAHRPVGAIQNAIRPEQLQRAIKALQHDLGILRQHTIAAGPVGLGHQAGQLARDVRALRQLAQPGAVAWVFERKGSIVVDGTKYGEDDIMAAAIDAGADDVVQDGDEFQVLTDPADFAAVRAAIGAAGIEYEQAELTMIPKNSVMLEENDARKTMKIVDALEDSDDVQEVFANFDIPEDVLESLAG